MTDKTLSKHDLLQFTGTECLYRHALVRGIVYTDGARHVAMTGGAYWLLDALALAQTLPAIKAEPFQVWTLTVNLEQRSAILVCDDGNRRVILRKEITYTDFPLDEMTLYVTDNTILLPSEY